ncbi:MAG: hypothetical protein FJ100_23390, partial [Deltaproteobacteria bacterium]|nr:hypothetical protein [Deltaproteobacteria bacterium]
CKPTIFFSKCQLSCTPAIIYKLRARIFFALGFGREELLRYYLDEYNADKPPREQQSRDWLLPTNQRERGWGVPAVALGLALMGLAVAARRWSRQRVEPPAAEAPTADAATTPDDAPPAVDPRLRRLRAEVQADDEAW